MEFGIVEDLVYTLYINKSDYEKDKQNWSCNTGNYLCTDLRQHLPRWLFLQSTCKSSGRDCEQKLSKQKKGCSIPQRIAKRVIEELPEEGKAWVHKRAWAFFLCHVSVIRTRMVNNVWL